MEGYLKRRLSDPRYTQVQRAVLAPPAAQVPWYAPAQAQPQRLHCSKYEASAKKDDGGEKAKKKQKKDGKDSSSSGSESDGKGGRRKKEKKKKGRCWTGYKPTPGKEPYSEGSCMKA